ncbi:hypothetical protein [Nocardioides daeguensis]|uniref:Secreted protein n=1 Tax=Nocardioides daeguensis TaxID=908359 RepID=A0ABP6UWF1_9ACTN|nr:hypothetical protein [Nocardioides daeguensis]MBV6725607.1 hypothetical protein [Nocardioides daeguensis]MCR1772878.1 hypothetical protein [Nocardioides daeguensis]
MPIPRALPLAFVLLVACALGLVATPDAESAARRAARPALVLKAPGSVTAGTSVEVRVRARGLRGKVALQVRRGQRWRTLLVRPLNDGGAGFLVPAGATGGSLRLRAKSGRHVSATRTVAVRPRTNPTNEQPVPNQDEVDRRCVAQYGSTYPVPEREHRVRPTGWPRTPPQAVLCRILRISDDEEVGCYATEPGTKMFDIFWYYDHAIEVADYAPIGNGQEILTGVLGDASFYIQQDVFDQYYIVWARDGAYEDDAVIAC